MNQEYGYRAWCKAMAEYAKAKWPDVTAMHDSWYWWKQEGAKQYRRRSFSKMVARILMGIWV